MRRRELGLAAALFAAAALFLALSAGERFFHQSKAPHFIYQAAALLDGRLDIDVDPPNLEDWVLEDERWYVSFPAMPAVVMLPFVALWGYQFNDTSFTLFAAALALALFFLLLQALAREEASGRTERENLLFAGLFGFGTLFFSCANRGEVWFTAEILGTGFTCLYLLCARGARRPWLAGLFWSAATLTRTPLLFSAVFFAAEVLWPKGTLTLTELRESARGRLGEWCRERARPIFRFALGALPLAAAHALFNWARFGSVGEFGHRLLYNNRVNSDIEQWGLFSYHYLERNLHAAFTRLPTLELDPLRIGFDPHGLSLLVTTPLLILLLWPKARPRLHRALWLTTLCVALPGLLYQNDGYMQFGFRFSLDYTPYLMLLLALGAWSTRSKLFCTLAALGVAVNTWGALTFRGFSW